MDDGGGGQIGERRRAVRRDSSLGHRLAYTEDTRMR
jgi:hypothetical protein